MTHETTVSAVAHHRDMDDAEIGMLRGLKKASRTPVFLNVVDGDQKSTIEPTGKSLDALVWDIRRLFPSIRFNLMSGLVENAESPAVIRHAVETLHAKERSAKTPATMNVKDAIEIVARLNSYDPLLEMLDALPSWDGRPRLNDWLTIYGRACPAPYVEAVGRKWLISAIARARKPGCQADYTLVLQGEQRTGKTSACRILGGTFYRTMTGKRIGERDTKAEIRHAWIAEFADLGALPQAERGVIKAFISDTHDSYTAKYAANETLAPRRCIFAITDNPDGTGWLNDATGGDRFWPVTTGRWDLSGLQRDRDQILAEAGAAFENDETWHIKHDDPVQEELHNQQASLQTVDEWENLICGWLQVGTGELSTQTEVGTVLSGSPIGIEPGKWGRNEQMRVAKILTKLGYVRVRRTEAGRRKWLYERKM